MRIIEQVRPMPRDGARVRVHFNLQRDDWVITQDNLVIAYVDTVALENASPRYYRGRRATLDKKATGQALSCNGGKRTVHAWFEGNLVTSKPRVSASAATEIAYNPHDANPALRREFHTRAGRLFHETDTIALVVFAKDLKAYGFGL